MAGYRKLELPDGEIVNVPNGMVHVIQMALWLARWELVLDANAPATRKVNQKDCLEFIFADYVLNRRYTFQEWCDALSPATRTRFDACARDDFMCIKCGSTGLQQGGIQSHHIIPKSWHGYRPVPVDDVRNLATLCAKCHLHVTNPTCEDLHWSAQAASLLRKIGETDASVAWSRERGDELQATQAVNYDG